MKKYLTMIENENKIVSDLLRDINKIRVSSEIERSVNKLLKSKKEFINYSCDYLDGGYLYISKDIGSSIKYEGLQISSLYIEKHNKAVNGPTLNSIELEKKERHLLFEYKIQNNWLSLSVSSMSTYRRLLFEVSCDLNYNTKIKKPNGSNIEILDFLNLLYSDNNNIYNEQQTNIIFEYLILDKKPNMELNDLFLLSTDININARKDTNLNVNILKLNESDNIENRLKI